jgi:hypothetical protein
MTSFAHEVGTRKLSPTSSGSVPFCPWISISRNGFIRDISARRDEVAASPEVSASVLFLNVFELHHHLSRNFFRGCKAHPSITHPAT